MVMTSLVNHVEEIRNAALVQDILLPVRPDGLTACYDRLAAVDYTAALTLLTLGFKLGASEYLVQSFVTPGAGFVCSTTGRIFVDSGFTPFVRVTGGGAGDRIALFAFGYLSDKAY